MSFLEIFQPGLRHLREERERQRTDVAHPKKGGPPLGIDLDAGTARIVVPRPAPSDPDDGPESITGLVRDPAGDPPADRPAGTDPTDADRPDPDRTDVDRPDPDRTDAGLPEPHPSDTDVTDLEWQSSPGGG
jgi:hypothetical protein